MNHWFEYVKSCYDLVLESEGKTKIFLAHEVEAYVVHLMARNFRRVNFGDTPIAIQVMEALQKGGKEKLQEAGDECLIIHSYPLRKTKWPTNSYYQDMGVIAYGMAGHMMEKNFIPASTIIYNIFNNREKA